MSSDEEPSTPEKKRFCAGPSKHYDQKFQHKWLNDASLKEWLEPIQSDVVANAAP